MHRVVARVLLAACAGFAPSWARNAVSCIDTDATRPQGAHCDLGAIESDRLFADNFSATSVP